MNAIHPASPASIPRLSASKIASYSAEDGSCPEVEIGQAEHRITFIEHWDIKLGSKVLEIGCGQGNCTTVLADAVGDQGHVDAIDPAPLDYGSPWTLGEAQEIISKSDVGARITWHQAQPEEFLEKTSDKWDVAVLAHSIWYFSSPDVLERILEELRGTAKRVCIAEYALRASMMEAVPHVMAAMARGMLESTKVAREENIRTLLNPRAIIGIAEKTGWVIQKEDVVTPGPLLQDGFWETSSVLGGKGSFDEARNAFGNEKMGQVLFSAWDAVTAAVERLEGANVRTMDVWVASFEEF